MGAILDKRTGHAEREWKRYVRRRPRSFIVHETKTYNTFFARVLRFILPWDIKHYPGRGRGMAELLGNHWAIKTIWAWHGEKSRVPLNALYVLCTHFTSHIEHAQGLLKEIKTEIAARESEVRKLAGCCAVDPETGRSKRYKFVPKARIAPREHILNQAEIPNNQAEPTSQTKEPETPD